LADRIEEICILITGTTSKYLLNALYDLLMQKEQLEEREET
jgi:hypothetical protein